MNASKKKLPFVAAACAVLLALPLAAGPGHAASAHTGGPPAMYAEVSKANDQGDIFVRYRNNTSSDLSLSAQLMASAVLALSVESVDGKVMLPMPPPTPDPSAGTLEIPARDEWTQRYSLNAMFDPPLPPGRYRVRVKLEGWISNECLLEIQ